MGIMWQERNERNVKKACNNAREKTKKCVRRANSGQVVQMCDVELCGVLQQRSKLQTDHE